jgi:hypothetical protein
MKKLFVLVFLLGCEPRNTVPPEDAAKAFLEKTGTKYEGQPDCTGGDTDRDGYVSCTIKMPVGDVNNGPYLSLQCASVPREGCDGANTPYTSGCKLTSMLKR